MSVPLEEVEEVVGSITNACMVGGSVIVLLVKECVRDDGVVVGELCR